MPRPTRCSKRARRSGFLSRAELADKPFMTGEYLMTPLIGAGGAMDTVLASALFRADGHAFTTLKPARGKCTTTSPTSSASRRIAISCASAKTTRPAIGSRP